MKRILQHINAAFHPSENGRDEVSDLPARSSRSWIEQGDLWNQKNPKTAAAPLTREAARATKDFDFSATEIVRSRQPRPAASRTQAGVVAYAERRRGLHAQNIGRFLEVNQTVQGNHGFAYRVIQAVRGASADYDLWKGPTKQVTFLLG
jgi:hypothetical protein